MKQLTLIFLMSIIVTSSFGQGNRTFQDISSKKGSKTNEQTYDKSDFGFTKSDNDIESYAIIRSTLGISGSTVTISSGDEIYTISQSVGQESVIGTFNHDEYILRQGYQQPNILGKIVPIPLESDLKASIYPNPFKQSVNIAFDELITGDIQVSIINIMGKGFLSQEFPRSQLINLPLQHLPKGIYVIRIIAINKQFTARITKQ